MNWKEQFDQIMPENWSDKGVSRKAILNFISTKFEELIDDIPVKIKISSKANIPYENIRLQNLKQQLRDKWL